jgi:hypothetical protein
VPAHLLPLFKKRFIHTFSVGKARKTPVAAPSEFIRRQRALWNMNVAICILLFFFLAVFWLAAEFGAIPQPDARTAGVLEAAELCAIAVFAIELYSRYRQTADKRKFLAQNWLAIIAILPIGIIIRAARAFEVVGLLRPVAGTLRLAEADFLMPAVAVSSRSALAVHRWLSHFQVFADFFSLVGGVAARARRIFR